MSKSWRIFAAVSLIAAVFAIYSGRGHIEIASSDSERFGQIRTYLGSLDPQRAYLIFASAQDWSDQVDMIARGLAGGGDLVIGVDETAYHERLAADGGDCLYLAGEIQRLSQSVQSGMKLPRYLYPVLIGYGPGASLAYTVLAQHPEPVFGGVMVNFSGAYQVPHNFCPGDYLKSDLIGGQSVKLEPNEDLPITAIGISLPGCRNVSYEDMFGESAPPPAPSLKDFTSPECGQALHAAIHAVQPDRDLPISMTSKVSDVENALVELLPDQQSADYFVLFLSGDGGWATIDKKLGEELQSRGIPVIGFDSLEYFWKRKTPEEAGKDIATVIKKYLAELKLHRFAIAGFSMGADMIPFILDEIPVKLKRQLIGVALLSPSRSADFEVHISDWIGIEETSDEKPILPQLKELGALDIACYYGEDESDDSLCTTGAPQIDRVIKFPGGHHFDEHYDEIADNLFDYLNTRPENESPAPATSP